MKTIKLSILGLVFILFSSCKKDHKSAVNETDYLIFGHYYGECIGESCVITYKLTETKLYEDLTKDYAGNNFSFQKLEKGKFYEAKRLMDYFPNQLLNETENMIGCPDCVDQGGLNIQYSKNGIVKSWRIDQSKNSVPIYLHEFMDKVNETILLLNK